MIDLSGLPYPIASLYHEMQAETQPGVRFRSLVRAFSGFLKFLSLIAVSDYLLGNHDDPALDELLSGEKLRRPSLGHWNEFLRQILQFHMRNGTEPRIDGLLGFYYTAGGVHRKLSPNVAAIDKLIALRNEYIHPDIWPSDAAATRLYDEHIGVLDKLYLAASFLTDYEFTFHGQGRRLCCHGPKLTDFRETEASGDDPEGFFIEKRDQPPLAFMAFLLFADAEEETVEQEKPPQDIMLYESRTAKWIKYLRGNHLRYRNEDAFAGTNDVLARLTKRLARTTAAPCGSCRKTSCNHPDGKTCTGTARANL